MNNISYEMIILAQDGDEDANSYIYNIFKPIIIKKSKNAIFKIANHGADIDDIIQEAYIGLDEAIKNYSQNEKTLFYTFAMICIERQIANFIRRVNSQKDKVLNDAIVIDEVMERVIGDNTNIENMVAGREYNVHIINLVKNSLTDFEGRVLDLKLNDYSLDEMAYILKKDKKSIYNAIQRIKNKFIKFNKNDN